MPRAKKSHLSQRPQHGASRAIDFDKYVPTIVARLAAKLRASAKLYFERTYGISLLDWRIISFLAAEGPQSAYDIWTLGVLDKAAVSRALRGLADRNLVAVSGDRHSARKRSTVSLTAAGRQLHDQSFNEIVRRHQRLVGALTVEQIDAFVWTVQYLDGRIPLMARESDQPLSGFDPTKDAYQATAK